jgi:DMSO reductase family type II enzyme heme b subunit
MTPALRAPFLLSFLAATRAWAAAPAGVPPALASEVVEVADLAVAVPADPLSPAWDSLAPATFVAAPQVSIRLGDERANAALARATNLTVRVRAATDGTSLGVLVEWPDPTEDRTRLDGVDAYGDAAAIQFPLRYGAGERLPYVGMGDERARVAVFLQRAGPKEAAARQAVGAGFGRLERADLGGVAVAMRRDSSGKGWRALFVRPLAAGGLDLRRGLVPFAVALWDGAAAERGGNKALTSWKLLRLGRFPVDPAYAAQLAWGYTPGDLGDPRKGAELFEGMCTACHSAGASRAPVPGIAPDLSRIGVIATPSYLRESIVAPSEVIVPNPNPAQHQDRAAKVPKGAAWPNDEAYLWYRAEADGRKTSTMPEFSLPKEELEAIVAYLRTLGADAPSPGAGGTP